MNSSTAIVVCDDHRDFELVLVVAGFLAGYVGNTRLAYQHDLRVFLTWCRNRQLDMFSMGRADIELFARGQESKGLSGATVARRLSTVASFYRYCVEEGLLDRSPAVNVRRPKVRAESTMTGLDRNELGMLLVEAGLSSPRDHALACLLALNGLRVSEALNTDITDLGLERGHHTLRIVRKGGRRALIPLAPRTARTVYQAIGDREEGPIFVHQGSRMERHHASRIIGRLARQAGIDKKISPHSLRHSFITAALDAGVPLRDVQEAASHADPRTTMRYDRARRSLDRHATYIVATFVAGASR